MPALSKASTVSKLSLTGPMVHTILVLRILKPPSKSLKECWTSDNSQDLTAYPGLKHKKDQMISPLGLLRLTSCRSYPDKSAQWRGRPDDWLTIDLEQ